MKKRTLIVLLAVTLLLAAGATVAGGAWRESQQWPQQALTVTVPQGAGTIAISYMLQEEGDLRWPRLLQWVIRRAELDGVWQPGTYIIPPGGGYLALPALMSQTVYVPDVTVTIPEGKQLKEIAKILDEAGICGREDFLRACEGSFDAFPFLAAAQLPGRNALEGYLFPDTYRFFPDTPPELVIERMLARFQELVCTEENQARAAALGYSLDEIVILASIVESEAATESDRRNIAGVFYNRLENTGGRMLQSCVTVEYALGIHKNIISYADTQFDSPYNTYLYSGLPIGPICCPSLMSIQAALWPEDNNYYYFQSDKYGTIWFAATFAEHLRIQDVAQKDWQVVTRIVGE